jgi:hypothetical protein
MDIAGLKRMRTSRPMRAGESTRDGSVTDGSNGVRSKEHEPVCIARWTAV